MPSPVFADFLNPVVEIIVDEGLEDDEKIPKIYVSLDFGLMLKVGDILSLNSEWEDRPKWIQNWENEEQLYDWGVTLTVRYIINNSIQFFGKRF